MIHRRESEGEAELSRGDDMVIRTGLGSIAVSGRIVILVILVLALLAFGVWHDFKSTEQNTKVIEALHEVSYVLTRSDAERKALKLEMPDSLRAKLTRQAKTRGE